MDNIEILQWELSQNDKESILWIAKWKIKS